MVATRIGLLLQVGAQLVMILHRSIPTVTIEQEIDVLRRSSIGNFTLDACARMAAVVAEIENAKTSYNSLLVYFGEEGKKGLQPHEVFQIISTFCRAFEAAVTVVVETETAQVRPSWNNTHVNSCIVLTVNF